MQEPGQTRSPAAHPQGQTQRRAGPGPAAAAPGDPRPPKGFKGVNAADRMTPF